MVLPIEAAMTQPIAPHWSAVSASPRIASAAKAPMAGSRLSRMLKVWRGRRLKATISSE
ncbi:hypothetical protein D3C72_2507660 [compost metagenome]